MEGRAPPGVQALQVGQLVAIQQVLQQLRIVPQGGLRKAER